jgi:uncharacterized protein (DUF362 family)/ferredoxin
MKVANRLESDPMAKVVLKQCATYDNEPLIRTLDEGIRQLADNGWGDFVAPGNTVLLKVNLISPMASETGAVTHAEFVRAMVRIMRREGCEVWIGDSSGGAIVGKAPTAEAFEVAGLAAVAREEGAKIMNFDREGVVAVTPASGLEETMYLAKPIFDADVVINLPKLKTHMMGMYTGAVKNVFGCIPGLKKAEYHRLAPNPKLFDEFLADIHEAGRFHLHIMDGIVAMQGEGPVAGEPYPAGKILMSRDPLALDLVAAKLIGLDPGYLPILDAAKERGIGAATIDEVQLAGDFSEVPLLSGFKIPMLFRTGALRGKRSVVFNMMVPFVDLMMKRPKINIATCQQCNSCVDSCPVQAIDRETKKIDYSICIECMCCHELCIYKAVELKRKWGRKK